MANTVLDILTRLSFETSDEDLQKVNSALKVQGNLVEALEAKQKRLDDERKQIGKTAEDYRRINTEAEKVKKALDNLNGGYKEQTGIINRLEEKQRSLQERMKSSESRQEVTRLNAELKQTERELGELTNRGQHVNETFRRIGEAIAVAFAVEKVVEFGKASIEEFSQAEESANRLHLALKNFGREDFFQTLDEQATALAGKFKYLDNDDLRNAQQKLVTYGKVSINQIKELLPVIVDFAANQRTSIDEATETIIRGLEGQGRAFKQIGVTFADGNNTAKNYQKVVSDVFAKVKGSAEDYLDTTAGKFATYSQEIRDLQEEIGGKLAPVIVSAKGSIKDLTLLLGHLAIFLIENRNIIFTFAGVYAAYQLLLARQNALIALNTEGHVLNTISRRVNYLATAAGNAIALIYNATVVLMSVTMDVLTGKMNIATAAQLYFGFGTKTALAGILGLTAGIGVVIGLIAIFATRASAATDASRKMAAALQNESDIRKKVNEITGEQIAKAKANLAVASDERIGIEKRTEALKELKDSAHGYLDALTLQNIKTKEGTDLVDAYIGKLKELATAQAVQQLAIEKEKRLLELDVESGDISRQNIQDQARRRQQGAGRNFIDELTSFGKDVGSGFGLGKGSTGAQFFANSDERKRIQAELEDLYKRFGASSAANAGGKNSLADKVITGETGGKDDKKGEELQKRRLAFLDELKKKEAELQKNRDELNARDVRVTSETIRKKIDAQRDAALTELKVLEGRAAREKLLTKENAAAIARIRKLIQDNADLQYQKDNADFLKKLAAEISKFNLEQLKNEVNIQQDFAKLRVDSLAERKALIDKETDIQQKEADAQYSEYARKAKELGLSDEQIEKDHQDRKFLITQNGNQRKLAAEIDELNSSNNELERQLDIRLSKIKVANNKEIEDLEAKYDRGLISTFRFNQEMARLQRQAGFAANQEQRLTLTKEATGLQTELASLIERQASQRADRAAGIVSADAVITDEEVSKVEKRIDDILEKLHELNESDRDIRRGRVKGNVDAIESEISKYGDLISTAANAAESVIQIEIDKNRRLIDEQQRRVDAIKDIATQGNAVLLKAEQDRLEKLQAASEKYTRSQRLLNAILVVSQNAVNIAKAVGAVVTSAAEGASEGGAVGVVINVIAALAAVAAGIASATAAINNVNTTASSTGFFRGGYTGDGDPHQTAGPVHKGEHVFDHKATKRIGVDTLERLRTGKMTPVKVAGGYFLADSTIPAMNYHAMERENNLARAGSSSGQPTKFDTKRIEQKLDAVVETLASIGFNVQLDKDGFAAHMSNVIAHQKKLENL